MNNNDEEDDDDALENPGPFCQHRGTMGECDEVCGRCGHACGEHSQYDEASECRAARCNCATFVDA
jgi:hypothetical protein